MNKELPARANLEHLKAQAKDLLGAFRRGARDSLERFRANLPAARGVNDAELSKMPIALHDAQSVIAREYGFATFAELRAEIERRSLSPEALRALMERTRNEPLPEAVLEAVRTAARIHPASPSAPKAYDAPLPVVPVRNAVVTVGSVVPLGIGRPTSVAAVRAIERARGVLALFTQRDETNEAPAETDLYPVGSVVRLVSTLDVPGRGFWIVVRATAWITLDSIERTEPYLAARVKPFEIALDATEEVKALEARLRKLVNAFVSTLPSAETLLRMTERMNALELADATVANLPAALDEKVHYASEASLAARLRSALAMLEASE